MALPKRPNGKVIFVKTKKKALALLKSEKRKGKDVDFVGTRIFFGRKFFGVATY